MIRTRLPAVSLCVALLACATTTGTARPAAKPEPLPPPPAAPAPLDPARLEAFVKSRGGIRACYQEELARSAGAHGRVLVRFTILQTGDVARVAVLKSELSPRLVQCVTESMASWQTPFRPAHPTTVEYPLVFKPE